MDTNKVSVILQEQRREILDILESGKKSASTVTLDQTSVGRLSRMDALQSQAILQEATRRREQLLGEIAVALSKIEAGNYGFCEGCDEKIAQKRLLINPTAKLCIDCTSKQES